MDSPILLYICIAGALFLVVCLGVGLGVVGAMIRVRNMQSILIAFEDRLAVLEGIVQREVKARAGRERWEKSKVDPLEAQLIEASKVEPQPKKMNWWQTTLPRSYGGK